jgi:hypothetical protein
MMECRECELAKYCYSESRTRGFQTKEEMANKQTAINRCPVHAMVLKPESLTKRNG